MNQKHTELVNRITEQFSENNFSVETEVPLPFGKGAVDVFAYNDNLKIYIEVKSSPQSINTKKVQSQLRRYKEFFGCENIYCLVSPDSKENPKICSLDNRINCSLEDYLNHISKI